MFVRGAVAGRATVVVAMTAIGVCLLLVMVVVIALPFVALLVLLVPLILLWRTLRWLTNLLIRPGRRVTHRVRARVVFDHVGTVSDGVLRGELDLEAAACSLEGRRWLRWLAAPALERLRADATYFVEREPDSARAVVLARLMLALVDPRADRMQWLALLRTLLQARPTSAPLLPQWEETLSGLLQYARSSDPALWADARIAQGDVLADDVGDDPVRVEEAGACYTSALEVFRRDTRPAQWAKVMRQLTSLYALAAMPSGDRVTHHNFLERAIQNGEAALEVLNPEQDLVAFVEVQAHLANGYQLREAGDWDENLERSIAHRTAVVEFWPHSDEYAAGHHFARAAAYAQRSQGDRWENLEQSLRSLNAALSSPGSKTLGPEIDSMIKEVTVGLWGPAAVDLVTQTHIDLMGKLVAEDDDSALPVPEGVEEETVVMEPTPDREPPGAHRGAVKNVAQDAVPVLLPRSGRQWPDFYALYSRVAPLILLPTIIIYWRRPLVWITVLGILAAIANAIRERDSRLKVIHAGVTLLALAGIIVFWGRPLLWIGGIVVAQIIYLTLKAALRPRSI